MVVAPSEREVEVGVEVRVGRPLTAELITELPREKRLETMPPPPELPSSALVGVAPESNIIERLEELKGWNETGCWPWTGQGICITSGKTSECRAKCRRNYQPDVGTTLPFPPPPTVTPPHWAFP